MHSSAPALLTGIVTDRLGMPLAGASVTATWHGWERAEGALAERNRSATTRADTAGRYELCDLPVKVQLSVQARHGMNSSPRVLLSLRDNAVVPVDLAVGFGIAGGDLSVRSTMRALTGIVTDSSGTPVPGVHLSVEGMAAATLSAATGDFDLGLLPPGDYVLRARRIGYRSQATDVAVSPDATAHVRIQLVAIPVQLSGVTATAPLSEFERSSGFAERRRRGPGVFFDRQDIEQRRPHNLTDLLRTVSGFRVETRLTRWGYQTTPSLDRAATGSLGCPVDFYVNGHEYTPTSMGIDNDVPSAQIEAIEVYKPSQIPAQFFGKRSRCGAVVIWTRFRAHELER